MFYSLCFRCLCVSSIGGGSRFPVSRPIAAFYVEIPAFYAKILCYLGLYARYRAWCEMGGAGGSFVSRRRPKPHMWFYLGLQFNLPARLPIPDPIPAPVPAGDCGAELCGSSVSRTLQQQFLYISLPTPVLEKGKNPFLKYGVG